MDTTCFEPPARNRLVIDVVVAVEKAIISAFVSLELQNKETTLVPVLRLAKRRLIESGLPMDRADKYVKQMTADMIERKALGFETLSKPVLWRGSCLLRETCAEIRSNTRLSK